MAYVKKNWQNTPSTNTPINADNLNHMEQVEEQLARTPRPLPTMRLNPERTSLFEFRYEDFTLEGYDPHPTIKAPMSF